jgi:allophanate hydrolase subunit 2
MTLHVLEPGLCTLVVDCGRPGYRSLGVPIGGAMDRVALAVGNALVGNPPDAAALEISLAGPTLRAGCELACVVFGAPFDLASDRQRLAAGTTFTLQPGEELRIDGTASGMRAYLCVGGGLQTPIVLGSRSSLQPLRADTVLDCSPGSIPRRFVRPGANGSPSWYPFFGPPPPMTTLRVVAGAQMDWFAPEDWLTPADSGSRSREFQVAPASNRMGLRLLGNPIRLPARELVSEPVCPGSIQVTRDGQCIILAVDGQTIGGYPKIAQVIAADLDQLGQLRPGAQVAFERVDLDVAETLYREKQAQLRAWTLRWRSASGG